MLGSETQTALYLSATALLEEQVGKIVSDISASETLTKRGVKGVVDEYRAPVQALKAAMARILPPAEAEALAARAASWRAMGVADGLADEAALMPTFEFAFDIVNIARETRWPAESVAALFFAAGEAFGIEAARVAARASIPENHFERLAHRRLDDALSARQGAIVRALIGSQAEAAATSRTAIEEMLAAWRSRNAAAIGRYEKFACDLDIAAGMSVGKLSLLTEKLGELVERAKA